MKIYIIISLVLSALGLVWSLLGSYKLLTQYQKYPIESLLITGVAILFSLSAYVLVRALMGYVSGYVVWLATVPSVLFLLGFFGLIWALSPLSK